MYETQQSITQWANDTFGISNSPLRAAIRANEEMAELLKHLAQEQNAPHYNAKIKDEIADVHIVLARVATICGVIIDLAVDEKMKINRARKWSMDGTGHGYHVKDEKQSHG